MVFRIVIFFFQNCLEGTNSTSCSAMVEEQKEVVGTCLMLIATTPACRYTPPHGKSIVMVEHKSCPSPAQISQPSAILRRVNSNFGNTGAKKTDIYCDSEKLTGFGWRVIFLQQLSLRLSCASSHIAIFEYTEVELKYQISNFMTVMYLKWTP